MNPIAEDISSYYGTTSEKEIKHYGMPKRSGRYPWGSGDEPFQHSGDFLSRVDELRKGGLSEAEVAKQLELTTTELRAYKAIAKNERRAQEVETARSLKEDGFSLNDIAAKMGYNNDSSVRALLNEGAEKNMNKAKVAADYLKTLIAEKGMIDVGEGQELELGISKEKLKQALTMLEAEGYPVWGGGVPQATNPGQQTILKVVCPPGTEHKEIYNYDNIHSIKDYTLEGIEVGKTSKKGFKYPESLDSKRLLVRCSSDKDEKGFASKTKDGLVEIRRGVPDLDLGASNYAQVRIMVDGTHYIKGMAVYSDHIPDGYDIVFNSNKKEGTPALGIDKNNTILKHIKDDPDNPFGSLIKENGGQSEYIDANGEKKLSLINKRAEEGDWDEWSDYLSSQFLSKQPRTLIKKQLDMTKADRYAEFDEICSLTNPTIKRKLLQSFADDCDAAAIHLKAASLPRQKYKVIIPANEMKDNEIYAPGYNDGEQVVLVRHPHGGTFEIPLLTVNNKKPSVKKWLGNAVDGVGINYKVAEQLSGADFDGDTVIIIPVGGKIKVKTDKPLAGLVGFDAKKEYAYVPGMRVMKNTQMEMGKISNLINDMTLKGATDKELTRAVKHSMVVIDAEKHKLNYKQSEIDNNISGLKKKYQEYIDENGKKHSGAATLISRSSSPVPVLKRKGSPLIDPETGEQSYKEVTETFIDKKTGKERVRTIDVPRMSLVRDARQLSSGTPQEELYADYSNSMKALANNARKVMLSTGNLKYSASAKAVYSSEVASLNAHLNLSLKNAPRERVAQLMTNATLKVKKQENPDLTTKEKKKLAQQTLTTYRLAVGAKRTPIPVSDREWEAIQAGAISDNQLMQILNNVDSTALRQRATPRTTNSVSQAQKNKIVAMNACGYTLSEIAASLNKPVSTISNVIRGKE